MLASAALVLLMTPGLAFFYGGMVRSKSVLNMMMMSFGAHGLVGILWVLYGYSLAFGNDIGGGLLGNPFEAGGLEGLVGSYTGNASTRSGRSRSWCSSASRPMFAIITLALISGAIADRIKFGAWLLFIGALGDRRVLPGGPLGVRVRRRDRRRRRLDRQRRSGRSTSPAAPPCTSTPVPPAWPWRRARQAPGLAARSRCGRTTCRS